IGHSTTTLVTQPSGQSGECITGLTNVSANRRRGAGAPEASEIPCIVAGAGTSSAASAVGATTIQLTGVPSTPRRAACGYLIISATCSRFWYGELAWPTRFLSPKDSP